MRGACPLDPDRLHQKILVLRNEDFFIHCESNGISSTMANLPLLYHISPSGLHIITRQRVSKSFRNDDIQQLILLMICNLCEIDDIHSSAVMIVHLVRFALAEHEGHKIGVICEANARGLPPRSRPSPPKNPRSSERGFFYPLRKQWYIINNGKFAIVVSHQSVRTAYHHASACIKKLSQWWYTTVDTVDDMQFVRNWWYTQLRCDDSPSRAVRLGGVRGL